jgi:hypothetical protein
MLNTKGASMAIVNIGVLLKYDFDPDGFSPLPQYFFKFKDDTKTIASSSAAGVVDYNALGTILELGPIGKIHLILEFKDPKALQITEDVQVTRSFPFQVDINVEVGQSEIIAIDTVAFTGVEYGTAIDISPTTAPFDFTLKLRLRDDKGAILVSKTPPPPVV